jgi:glycine cleavage system H protein
MTPLDGTGTDSAKALEYLIAVAYLLLFVPFWRLVNGGRAREAAVPAGRAAHGGWFSVPAGLRFHPGHAWVDAPQADGVVTVGWDDFARKLMGPLTAVRLPAPGSVLAQGETGWRLLAGSSAVDMLSPLAGTVVAVNGQVAESPAVASDDPYGDGWLLKVRPSRWEADRKQLLSDGPARTWMEGVADDLRARAGAEPGPRLQDGGAPVAGIARELDPEGWAGLARSFLLSGAEGGGS